VTRSYWDLITKTKHPVMAGKEFLVKKTLNRPAQIRISRSDSSVYLFYQHRNDPIDGSVQWQRNLMVKAF